LKPSFPEEISIGLPKVLQGLELAFPFEDDEGISTRWFFPSLLKSVQEDEVQFQQIYYHQMELGDRSSRFARFYQFAHVTPNGIFLHFLFRICETFNSGFQQRKFWRDAVILRKFAGVEMAGRNLSRRIAIRLQSRQNRILIEANGIGSSFLLEEICLLLEQVILEWYPGLSFEVRVRCQCNHCGQLVRGSAEEPTWYFLHYLKSLIRSGKEEVQCQLSNSSNSTVFIYKILHEKPPICKDHFLLSSDQITSSGVRLGLGTFSNTFRGVLLEYQDSNVMKDVAIKKCNTSSDRQTLLEKAVLMSKLEHENIVKFYGVYFNLHDQCMVFEYVEGRTLYYWLSNEKRFHLPINERFRIALEIAKGMEYLHDGNKNGAGQPIIHRDLNPKNILIVSNGFRSKIYDIGLGFSFRPFTLDTVTIAGDPAYIAPEVFSFYFASSQCHLAASSLIRFYYDEKVDVWSYGMLLWSLFTELIPFELREDVDMPFLRNHALRLQEEECYRPPIPAAWRDTFQDKSKQKTMKRVEESIKKCWKTDPSKRPSFRDIVRELSVL